MNRTKNTLIASISAFVIVLATGWETGFVTRAARTSLASFVTEVFAGAVDGTLNP